MSLLVHLPLTGNLENKGLANVTVTNNGATVDDNGKIGKCYSFNGSNNWISSTINITDSMSFCTWVYFNSLGSSNGAHIMDARINDVGYQPIYVTSNTIQIGENSGGFANSSYNFSLNTWYHICVVYTPESSYVYINGVKIASPSSHGHNYGEGQIIIGCRHSKNNYFLNGKLNDIRIYDHALSPKEVKEISKGLIAHYKLDDMINPNLLIGNFSVYKTSTTVTTNGNLNSIPAQTIFNNRGKTLLLSADIYSVGESANTNSSSNRFGIHGSIDYTLSGSSSSTRQYPLCLFSPGYNGRVSVKWTIPSNIESVDSSLWFADQASTTSGFYARPVEEGVTWYYKNVKLEFSDVPTMYDSNNTIYDCSGYGHNGTTVEALSLETGSPRYKYCIKNTSGYPCKSMTPINFPISSGLTICCWVNLTTWGNQISGLWATSNSSTSPIDYNTTTCNHKDYTFDMRGTNGTTYHLTCGETDIPINIWKHVVVTHDGANAKLYINGTLIRTLALPSSLVAFNYIYLGYSHAGGLVRKCQGSWSDFRIYATALSADDVKELYNTSAFITDNGTTECYEFDEIDDELSVGKNGIMKIGNLYEAEAKYTDAFPVTVLKTSFSQPDTGNNRVSKFFSFPLENAVPGKKYTVEYDFIWEGTWAASEGTLSVRGWGEQVPKSGYSIGYSSSAGDGIQYEPFVVTSTSGTYHYKRDFIMINTCQNFTTWRVGIRVNYSDGNGRYKLENFKIYPVEMRIDTEQTKIGDDYITSNNFIEI